VKRQLHANKPDIIDLLSPEQLKRLDHSLQQAKEGKTKTHEEVMIMDREWLKAGSNEPS